MQLQPISSTLPVLACLAITAALTAASPAARAQTCDAIEKADYANFERLKQRAAELLKTNAQLNYEMASRPGSTPEYTIVLNPKGAATIPPDPHGRWHVEGRKVVYNCSVRLGLGDGGQADLFNESARVSYCGVKSAEEAARCTKEAFNMVRSERPNRYTPANCAQISKLCVAKHTSIPPPAANLPPPTTPAPRPQAGNTPPPQGQGQVGKPSGVSGQGAPQSGTAPPSRASDITGTEKPKATLESTPQGQKQATKPSDITGTKPQEQGTVTKPSGVSGPSTTPQGTAPGAGQPPPQGAEERKWDFLKEFLEEKPTPPAKAAGAPATKEGGVRLDVKSQGKTEDLDRNDVLKLLRKPGT